jgi:1-acyl-sn-glycerol-3-phosphate acyltransferase
LSRFATLVRPIIFNILFYLNVVVLAIPAIAIFVLPMRMTMKFARAYGASSLWLLRVICGIKVEWRGGEKIPKGACIIACKHQSLWETFALFAYLDDPAMVLKRELTWIPVLGWMFLKGGMIPIDRSGRVSAVRRMTARARKAIESGRQIVIFPEGTRRSPGAEPSYKSGVATIYRDTGAPCVPVALNSGLFWPRRSLLLRPGTVLVQILDPIPPGLDKRAFLTKLQGVIEQATARLIAEGERELESKGRNQT